MSNHYRNLIHLILKILWFMFNYGYSFFADGDHNLPPIDSKYWSYIIIDVSCYIQHVNLGHKGEDSNIMNMMEHVAFLPTWFMVAWLATCILFSPFAIFFVLCLPQIPLLVLRRLCYIPFEYIWRCLEINIFC